MSDRKTVIAVGHTWPDLDVEKDILAEQDIAILDGRTLDLEDVAWSKADGVLLGTAHKLDGGRLKALKQCRGVVRYGIGYDNVDVATAEKLGIPVGIIRDYCLDEVAEHALAMALALARGLPYWDRNIRAGNWRGNTKPHLRKLSSLSFGIAGFGLIGRTLAHKAQGLFGQVLVFDPLLKDGSEAPPEGITFIDELDGLLAQSDLLSLHVPLTATTEKMIDARALDLMKPSAAVINVSRGGLVDEAALLQAVRTGKIAGAALDTFSVEPMKPDHPFIDEPNIILSPHVAWLSQEAEIQLRVSAARDIGLILTGREPSALVTKVNTRLAAAAV